MCWSENFCRPIYKSFNSLKQILFICFVTAPVCNVLKLSKKIIRLSFIIFFYHSLNILSTIWMKGWNTFCRYEITVEDQQPEFDRKGSQRKDDPRPETSFGLRQNETRSSKKDKSYPDIQEGTSVQKRIEELQKRSEQDGSHNAKCPKDAQENEAVRMNGQKPHPQGESTKRPEETPKKDNGVHQYANKEAAVKSDSRKDDLEYGMSRLKIQNQGSGSDYDKAGQSSSNVDSGRGSAVYSSGRRPMPEEQGLQQGRDLCIRIFLEKCSLPTYFSLFTHTHIVKQLILYLFIYSLLLC